jgi:hypothetical protein
MTMANTVSVSIVTEVSKNSARTRPPSSPGTVDIAIFACLGREMWCELRADLLVLINCERWKPVAVTLGKHIFWQKGIRPMKTKLPLALAALLLALGVTGARAQDVAGRYHCVQFCKGGSAGPAFINHAENNIFDFVIVNEVGQQARAWIDFPGHIWIKEWNEGAVMLLDGETIEFSNGTVWRRFTLLEQYFDPFLAPAPPAPSIRRR